MNTFRLHICVLALVLCGFALVTQACIPAPAPSPATAIPTPAEPTPTPVATATPEVSAGAADDTPAPTATAACANAWFVPQPPPGCPALPPVYSPTTAQHFEHGLIIWREKPDFYGSQIYVIFDDGKSPQFNPTNDRWRPGLPETDPGIAPPAGFFQPVRGVGMFWREAYFGQIGLSARERLGWATDEEAALGELPFQCRSADSYEGGCYMMGPDKVVYVLQADNTWSALP